MSFKANSKYNIGIVGANFGLATVAPAILKSNSFSLACMADSSSTISAKYFPGSTIIKKNSNALMADPNIDIVWVATPPNTHFTLVESALLSGKTVICEKPAGHTTQETNDLSLLSIKLGLPIFLDFEFRYDPIYTRVFEIASQIPEMQFFEFVIQWKTFARFIKGQEGDHRTIFLDFVIHVLDCLLDFAKRIGTTFISAKEDIGICSICVTNSQNCALVHLIFVRFSATIVICRNYAGLGMHKIDLHTEGSLISSGITQPYSSDDLFFAGNSGESHGFIETDISQVDSFYTDMRIYSVGRLLIDIEKFLSCEASVSTPPVIQDALTAHKVIDEILRMGFK